MAATAEASSQLLAHQLPATRLLLSASSDQLQEAHAALCLQQQQLAMAAAGMPHDSIIFHEAAYGKNRTNVDDLQHILETTKHKHYRRRRSSVAKHTKVESQNLKLQTLQLISSPEENPEPAPEKAVRDQPCEVQQMESQQGSQVQHRLKLFQPVEIQAIMQADMFLDHSSPADSQGAMVVHKPRPLPLRPAICDFSFPEIPACVKLLFDRDYECLVQWQKKEFEAFTQEIQEILGGTLKKCIREYKEAFELFCQPTSGQMEVLQASTAGAAAASTSSSSKTEHDEDSDDYVSLKARQQHLASFTCEKKEKNTGNSARPGKAEGFSEGGTKEKYSKHRKLEPAHEPVGMQELQKQKLEIRVLDSFVRARDAVVCIREASHRIEEHKAWILSELNLTRLELLNLKFSRSIKPRSVLCEVMELAAVVRSFIMELSIALDREDLGGPWPLQRKADCSDVTPVFLKHLIATL